MFSVDVEFNVRWKIGIHLIWKFGYSQISASVVYHIVKVYGSLQVM